MSETIDIPSTAVAVHKPEAAIMTSDRAMTAAQAKVEAVANLTMKAYERASTLVLSAEEVAAIQAEFPDEAFQTGAAGKENLIYIEHAHLRDRLNQVFGPGQWVIVPRSRWAEDFRTEQGKDASRVYVEAMLLIRGCFVAEAVGDMVYYKNNASQNYGDAVEGAKTAALRRCAKELGIGLQAWKKEFCEGWWARKRSGTTRRPQSATPPVKTPPAPQSAAPKPSVAPPAMPTKATRTWFIMQMAPMMAANGPLVLEYFQKIGQLLPTEGLEDVAFRFLPASKPQLLALMKAIGAFEAGEEAKAAFPAHDATPAKPAEPPKAQPEPEEMFEDIQPDDAQEPIEPWRRFPMPFGKKAGTALEDLEKNYLFGLWANYEVETEYNGNAKKPEVIAKDAEFRKMLDMAGQHYKFEKKD